ncbi:MAG: ABC transporter substrate-binding protein [Candidatus Rokuibacteriota bacterium]|nr:MAG: ABC transporter substrate-binding protein [Candidatus Rokubacteria bacterium]
MQGLTVYEPFRSVFYAPQFVTLYGGHFAAEGLDVEVRTSGGGMTTTGALLDGTAHICLGGIMRSLDLADRGQPFLPHFAEVNSRNGFFLLSRRPRPSFAWADLAGRTLLGFAEAPTPWQCLLTVLRRHGVDPASVRIERTLPAAEAVAAFRADRADFLEAGQPVTEQLLDAGEAHLVASMGEATGPVPFSSYMTTGRFLREQRDTLVRFTRALYRAQRWMAGASADAIAALIAPAFPDIAPDVRLRAVARYLGQSTWARQPVLTIGGYGYLQQILLDGGFIRHRHRYEDLIDDAIAREVVETP